MAYTFEIWGHRGCNNNDHFQNSLSAFKHAFENAQGFETDCVKSKDNKVFHIHDTWYSGSHLEYEIRKNLKEASAEFIGDRRIDELNSVDAGSLIIKDGSAIPKFDELLDLWEKHQDKTINLELKGEDVLEPVLETLSARNIPLNHEKIVYSSFAHQPLLELRKKVPTAKIAMLYALYNQDKGHMYPWSKSKNKLDDYYHYTPLRKEFIDQEMIGSINPDFFCFEAESYLFHAKPYIDELYPNKGIVLWTYGPQVKVHENEKVVSALRDPDLTNKVHAIIVDYPDEMKEALS